MRINFAILFLIFAYFCAAMDDPKGKREMVPLLPQAHDVCFSLENSEGMKFKNDDEKKIYKELFKTLAPELQKTIKITTCRLCLFDEVYDEFVRLQTNPVRCGDKTFSAFELWQIPKKQRLAIQNMHNPSVWRWSNIPTEEEFYQATENLPKDLKAGLSARVVEDECLQRKGAPLAVGSLLFGGGLGLEIFVLVEMPLSLLHFMSFALMFAGSVMTLVCKNAMETDLKKRVSFPGVIDDEEYEDDNHVIIQITSDEDQ